MLVRETDASGRVISRSFDARSNLLTETNGLNQTTSTPTTPNDNVTSVRDGLGNTVTTTYNARNQVLTRTDAAARHHECLRHRGQSAHHDRPPRQRHHVHLRPLGQSPHHHGRPGAGWTRFEYDGSGKRDKETDAAGPSPPIPTTRTGTASPAAPRAPRPPARGRGDDVRLRQDRRLVRSTIRRDDHQDRLRRHRPGGGDGGQATTTRRPSSTTRWPGSPRHLSGRGDGDLDLRTTRAAPRPARTAAGASRGSNTTRPGGC